MYMYVDFFVNVLNLIPHYIYYSYPKLSVTNHRTLIIRMKLIHNRLLGLKDPQFSVYKDKKSKYSKKAISVVITT